MSRANRLRCGPCRSNVERGLSNCAHLRVRPALLRQQLRLSGRIIEAMSELKQEVRLYAEPICHLQD